MVCWGATYVLNYAALQNTKLQKTDILMLTVLVPQIL